MSNSNIREFYANQNVFITGGTGFLGKVLTEKLLRSTEVATIYLLIREKKSLTVEERLENTLNNMLFSKLKIEQPNFQKRVVAIPGNCVSENLGLSQKNENELISKINIVFHLAATTRFDTNLKIAFDINVKATENVLEMCKKFQHLKALVHVSTAYSYSHLDDIDEVLYDFPWNHKEIESILKDLSLDEALQLTPKILKGCGNTYTFTKALAESLIKENSDGLPIAIFRPGIVTATYKEPFENWFGATSGSELVIKTVSLGLTRIIPCDPHFNVEFVPADLAISALISIAWNTKNEKIKIYNYVSSVDNPITNSELFSLCAIRFSWFPFSDAVWAPKLTFIANVRLYNFLKFFFHYLPAVLLDFVSLLCLKKPKFVAAVRKIDDLFISMVFFVYKNWNFKNENVKVLWKKMNETDQKLFCFDIRALKWVEFLRNFQKGLRVYLVRDSMDTLSKAKIKLHRFEVAHHVVFFAAYFFAMNLIGAIFLKLFS